MKFDWKRIKSMLRQGRREYQQREMRWSYLAIGILIVCGALINLVGARMDGLAFRFLGRDVVDAARSR